MAVALADVRRATANAASLNFPGVLMHKWIRILSVFLGVGGAPAALHGQDLLTTGTVLVYRTPDGSEREWVVDEASMGISHGGRSGCIRIRYAAAGPTAGPDERLTCVAGDTLMRWSTARSQWLVSRPIVSNREFTLPLASGSASYLTQGGARDTISAEIIPIVETVVLTRDSSGVAIRRLTERYAPGLGTATWGRFETRDTSLASGWRTAQEFSLGAIRRPTRAP